MSWFRSEPKAPRREGLISLSGTGAGLLNRGERVTAVAEVYEIERVGNMVKVGCKDITGASRLYKGQFAEDFPAWVDEKTVTWKDQKDGK